MKGIARELSIDQRTVRNFITAGAFPERAPRARGPTPLDPYLSFYEGEGVNPVQYRISA